MSREDVKFFSALACESNVHAMEMWNSWEKSNFYMDSQNFTRDKKVLQQIEYLICSKFVLISVSGLK